MYDFINPNPAGLALSTAFYFEDVEEDEETEE